MPRGLTDDHESHEHCGCCGNCAVWLKGSFCVRCMSKLGHLGHGGPPWDRTYEAVHGTPCPFAIP